MTRVHACMCVCKICIVSICACVYVIIKNPQKITIGNNELNRHNLQLFIYNM